MTVFSIYSGASAAVAARHDLGVRRRVLAFEPFFDWACIIFMTFFASYLSSSTVFHSRHLFFNPIDRGNTASPRSCGMRQLLSWAPGSLYTRLRLVQGVLVVRRTSCTTSAALVCDGDKQNRRAHGVTPWPRKRKNKNLISNGGNIQDSGQGFEESLYVASERGERLHQQ